MDILIIPSDQRTPNQGVNRAYLKVDQWDDYYFKSTFHLSLHDEEGNFNNIGGVKVGFIEQETGKHTSSTLDGKFQSLPEGYFSVGLDVEYYQKLYELPEQLRQTLLVAMKDVVQAPKLLAAAQKENLFRTSLLRDVSLSVIKGQFSRVIAGNPPLTNFEFKFSRPAAEEMSGVELAFKVEAESSPGTNIHTIIGRNGVGKTTLLNGMIEAIMGNNKSKAQFYDVEDWSDGPIDSDYFSSLVSVSPESVVSEHVFRPKSQSCQRM